MSLKQSELSTLLDQYTSQLEKGLDALGYSDIGLFVSALHACQDSGGVVYTCGNGGSAANASHLAAHLNQAGIRSVCLTDNVPWVTATSNDADYGSIFSDYVQLVGNKDNDLVFIISGSGNSFNVERLIIHGWSGLALLGMDGGRIKALIDGHSDDSVRYILVPVRDYGPIEDIHSALIHMIYQSLKALTTE